MRNERYAEDWGQHNAVSHPYFYLPGQDSTDDPLPPYLRQFMLDLDQEQREDVMALLALTLRRIVAVICNAESRENARASAIAARAVLLHRALIHPELNTRDMAAFYGVPGNAIYDEQKALDKELDGLAKILH